jgi:hypothetical protein
VIRRVLLIIVALAATIAATCALSLLDKIVQGTLYSYGLLFNYGWANPYWNLLRVTQILLLVAVATTATSTVFTAQAILKARKPRPKATQVDLTQKVMKNVPVTTRIKEKVTIPHTGSTLSQTIAAASAPTQASPQQSPLPQTVTAALPQGAQANLPGPIKCTHCGKAFTQPLRMLDFQYDRPRIVSICPFCNETTSPESSTSPQEKKEQDQRQGSPKKNNHAPDQIA